MSALTEILQQWSVYLVYAERDNYGRPDSCSLGRLASISPKIGAGYHVAAATVRSGYGKNKEAKS